MFKRRYCTSRYWRVNKNVIYYCRSRFVIIISLLDTVLLPFRRWRNHTLSVRGQFENLKFLNQFYLSLWFSWTSLNFIQRRSVACTPSLRFFLGVFKIATFCSYQSSIWWKSSTTKEFFSCGSRQISGVGNQICGIYCMGRQVVLHFSEFFHDCNTYIGSIEMSIISRETDFFFDK